jgi:hypothetical protein
MAELHQIASDTDLYPVFTTGKKLNKKAFPGKSKVTPDHAVLVAGVVRGDLTPSQLDHIMEGMEKEKDGSARNRRTKGDYFIIRSVIPVIR